MRLCVCLYMHGCTYYVLMYVCMYVCMCVSIHARKYVLCINECMYGRTDGCSALIQLQCSHISVWSSEYLALMISYVTAQ